jgi:hypothetical protein|tara:strand:- start:301 stop:444 length:144 start_codon:yes stop_codon:yes gene_type:complete
MELVSSLGLILFVVSEILPYTPLKGNGIVQELVEVLRAVFPYASKKK